MNTPLDEQELIRAIKNRKRIGAEALYDQYAAVIFKVICCTIHNPEMAETSLEDTLLHAWEDINDYRPENGRLLLWLAGLARAAAKNTLVSGAEIFVPVTAVPEVTDVPLIPLIIPET
jgi:DNA-directed RNA polymerase specialized sigma24 family protein